MRIPVEIIGAFVAGLFGLIPVMVQIASTRAQRKDRMTRLNNLRAELELLDRINFLYAQIGTGDQDAERQVKFRINSAVSNLLDEYTTLATDTPRAAVVGSKQLPQQKPSVFKRTFLLYSPNTTSGWVLHTIFYVLALMFIAVSIATLADPYDPETGENIAGILFAGWVFIFGTPLLIVQRLARRVAARLEEPDS